MSISVWVLLVCVSKHNFGMKMDRLSCDGAGLHQHNVKQLSSSVSISDFFLLLTPSVPINPSHISALCLCLVAFSACLSNYSLFSDFYQLLKATVFPLSLPFPSDCIFLSLTFLSLPLSPQYLPDVSLHVCLLIILLPAALKFYIQPFSYENHTEPPHHCLRRSNICLAPVEEGVWAGSASSSWFWFGCCGDLIREYVYTEKTRESVKVLKAFCFYRKSFFCTDNEGNPGRGCLNLCI